VTTATLTISANLHELFYLPTYYCTYFLRINRSINATQRNNRNKIAYRSVCVVIARTIMRVLLARRFRGNSNAAYLLEEEGEYPQGEIGEDDDDEEEAAAIIDQTCEGQLQVQQAQTKPQEDYQNLQKQLLFTGKDSSEKRLPQQPFSVLSLQQQQQQQPSPQRKRRLAKSAQEENDCKLRRRQASSTSNKEELSLLDRKPRARETGIVRNNNKTTSGFTPEQSVGASSTGENTIQKEAAFSSSSSSSKVAPLPTSRSNATKATNHKMVNGGPGGNEDRRHGNSREGQEEENLLNWQYGNNNNHHPHHAVDRRRPAERDRDVGHDEPEIIVPPTPVTGFERPLENDPASARGDLSSASPGRQNHDNGCSPLGSSSAVRLRDSSNFVIGRLEESPSLAPLAIRNPCERIRIAPASRMAPLPPNRRDLSRIAPATGSERGPSSLQATDRSGRNFNTNKNETSTTVEEVHFRAILKKERRLEIREQDGDGNCLFRAISLQVYGDPSMHGDVRKQCMDHMERDQEHFSQFVTGEPFLQYVARTRQDGVHGNNPEIQASSELFNRPIEVFTPENGSSPLNIFHAEYKTGDVPIRLSYHDGNHYNAVIDPLVPTAGLGLGLPGLKPGYADKMQMAKAVAESMDVAADQDETELQQVLKASQLEYNNNDSENDDYLQRAIKESQLSAEHMSSNNALSLSDMDATYFDLEQAALERSLQSYSQKEDGKKQRASTISSRPTTGDSSKPKTIRGDHKAPAVAAATASSRTAYLPCPSQESIPLAAVAASSSVASAAARGGKSSSPTPPQRLLPVEEYPSSVQELVMNGFPLNTVVKAFDLVGNNFDHMLSLCLANANLAS